MEAKLVKALATLVQPVAQSAGKRWFESRRTGDMASDVIVGALMEKLSSVIKEADAGRIAAHIVRKEEYVKLRKQLNLEHCIELALELAQEAEPEKRRTIDEDWFIQWFSAVEEVTDARIQEIWARAFAAKATEGRPNISLRALDTLRLMQHLDVLHFSRFAEFSDLFGFLFCNGDLIVDATIGRSGLDILLDLQLVTKEETTFANVPVPGGLTIRWSLPEGLIPADPFKLYRLSSRGRELAATLPPAIKAQYDDARMIDLTDPLARARYLNLIAASFDPRFEVYLDYYEPLTGSARTAGQKTKAHLRSHRWNADGRRWTRLVDLETVAAETIWALESGYGIENA
jgi:hypothetical protein